MSIFQESALNLPFFGDWRGRWFHALCAWLLYVVTFEAIYGRAGRTAYALGVLAPVAVAAISGLAPALVTMLAVQGSNFFLAKLVGLFDPHPLTNAALSTSVTCIPLLLTSGLRILLLRMTRVNRELDAQIEQRKQVERTLERNLALHQNLLSSLGEGVAGFDAQDRFLFANEATGLLLGVPHDALLGRPLSEFLARGSGVPSSSGATVQRASSAGSTRVSYDLKLNGPGMRTVLVTQTQMSPSVDSEIRTLRVMRDITERERLERDRFELEQHLQRTEALQSLAVLAGGVAHDVKNLLSGVIGCTELGLRRLGHFPGEVGEHLEEARRFAFEASELSRKMLAYAGKHQFTPVPIDLAAAVFESLRFVSSTVSDRLTIVNQIPEILPQVFADNTAVHQITTNLVLNAAEATPSGARGRLVLCAYQETVRRKEEDSICYGVLPVPGDYVVLSVTDSGTGMSVETRARLFEPFYSTKAHGRGMGLAATMAILKSIGGGIAVRSEVGQGSTFLVYWPVANQLTVPARAKGQVGRTGATSSSRCYGSDVDLHDGTGLKLRS